MCATWGMILLYNHGDKSAAVPHQPLIQPVSHRTAGLVKRGLYETSWDQMWEFCHYNLRKDSGFCKMCEWSCQRRWEYEWEDMIRMLCKQKLVDRRPCRLADLIETEHNEKWAWPFQLPFLTFTNWHVSIKRVLNHCINMHLWVKQLPSNTLFPGMFHKYENVIMKNTSESSWP